jgi:ABC-type Fe3+ transport system permease subunit
MAKVLVNKQLRSSSKFVVFYSLKNEAMQILSVVPFRSVLRVHRSTHKVQEVVQETTLTQGQLALVLIIWIVGVTILFCFLKYYLRKQKELREAEKNGCYGEIPALKEALAVSFAIIVSCLGMLIIPTTALLLYCIDRVW